MEIDAIHEAEAEGSCNVRERTVRSSPPETSCGSPLHVTLRSSPPSSLPGGQLQVPSPCSPSPSHRKPQPPVVDMDHATCTHAAVPAPQCPTAAMRPAYNALPFSCFAVVCMRGMRALRCPAHVVASGPIPHTHSLRPPPRSSANAPLPPLSLCSLSLSCCCYQELNPCFVSGIPDNVRVLKVRQVDRTKRDKERETGSERQGARDTERENEQTSERMRQRVGCSGTYVYPRTFESLTCESIDEREAKREQRESKERACRARARETEREREMV